MKKFINIVSVMVALAVTSMAAPMTMLTVPDAQPLLDSSDPFGFGYTMTLNGVTLAWTNQPTAYISDTNAVNRQTTITVNGQPALLTTNPVFTISGASPVTVRVNEQTGSTSSNMAFSVTAAGIGALTNEATTLAQAAERGGFSGTETIMPLSLFCGIPSFYGSTVSDVGVKTLSPSGVQASLSTDDGLVLLTPNAFTWEIKGDTLDYTRTDIPSQKSSWSFAHGIGSFVVAAISDIPVALTNAGVWQAIEDAQTAGDNAASSINNHLMDTTPHAGYVVAQSNGTATNLSAAITFTMFGYQWSWDTEFHTFNVALDGGVNMQLGQEQLVYAKNSSGATLEEGRAVCIIGATGDNVLTGYADSQNVACKWTTIGLVTQAGGITNGGHGYVCTFGNVNDFDTSMWQVSNTLWLASNGMMTNAEPAIGSVAVKAKLATVSRSHANQGRVQVGVVLVPNYTDVGAVDAATVTNIVLANQQCARAWMPMVPTPYGYLDIPTASNSVTPVMGAPMGSFVVRFVFGFGATNSTYNPITIFCDDSSGDPRNSHGYIATTTDVINTTFYGLTNSSGYSPGWIVREKAASFHGTRRNIAFYTRGVPVNTRMFPVWSPITPYESSLPSNVVWYATGL